MMMMVVVQLSFHQAYGEDAIIGSSDDQWDDTSLHYSLQK